MPKYKVDIGGKKYLIEADSPEALPEIVDDISSRTSSETKESGLTKVLSSSDRVQKTGDPLIDFMLFTQKEVVGPLAQGANTAAFGLPKVLANKINPEFSKQMFPEQSAMGGKILRGTADLGGLVGGGAAKLGQKAAAVATKGLARGLGRSAIRGAVAGGVGGGAQVFGDQIDIGQQATQAGAGALFGTAIGAAAHGIGNLLNIRNVVGPKGAQNAEKIRREFQLVKKNAVDKFGQRLDDLVTSNPEKTVDATSLIEDLKANLIDMPQNARNALRSTPHLGKAINGEGGLKLTVKQAQEAINYINTKIPKNIKSTHLGIVDTVSDLKALQAEAFPEMAAIRAEYAKVIEPYNNVKNYFKFNKLLNAIEGDFGGPEGMKAVKSLLPKEVIEEMGGMKAAMKAMKTSKTLLKWAAGITAGGVAGDRIIKGVTGR